MGTTSTAAVPTLAGRWYWKLLTSPLDSTVEEGCKK